MTSALHHVLAAPPIPRVTTLEHVRAFSSPYADTIDRAIAGGFAADRLGFAFALGYEAALRALVPDLERDGVAAFCVTEERGGHPRAIATRLDDDGRVNGTKRFATMASVADRLLVVASVGASDDGRNRLRVAVVDARGRGITTTPLAATPFAPEIPHAEIRFDDAPALRVLEGDGYDRYVKPFRTVEDAHVLGAALGYVASFARRSSWPREIVAEIAALLVATRALAMADTRAPETHVALAGTFAQARGLFARTEAHWPTTDAAERERWLRDKALLEVAGRVRDARTDAAFRALAAS